MGSLIVYLCVFFFSAMCLDKGKRENAIINGWSLIGLATLILFAAGRYHVGTDCDTYINMFERYAKQPWLQVLKNGSFLFCGMAKICYVLGGRVLTWGVFGAMIVIPIYVTIYRYYPKLYGFAAFYSFLVLYYSISFNVTRQFIAVAIIFWGIKFVFENKLVSFLLVVLCAAGFHVSAPVAGLMWFLWDHKKNRPISGKKSAAVIAAIVVLVFGYQNAIRYVTDNISILENYASFASTSTRGQNRDLYLHIIELVGFLFLKKRIEKKDKRIEFAYLLLIISVLIGFTGFTHPQVKRLAYYYAVPSKMVLFGYLPYGFTEKSRKIAIGLVVFYLIAYFTLTAYVLGEGNLIPYQFDMFSAW